MVHLSFVPRRQPPFYFRFCAQVHNASNANQKEKYEADLKKEIKKLQVNLGASVAMVGSAGYICEAVFSAP